MKRDEILRMARSAFEVHTDDRGRETFNGDHWCVEEFFALVAAKVAKCGECGKAGADGWALYCVKCCEGSMIAAAVAAEREECARICDGWRHADGDQCADAIRARGEK